MSIRCNSAVCRVLACMPLLVLAGCSGGDSLQDLRDYVAATKARPGGQVEKLPEIAQVETFFYLPADRRDPFAPSEHGGEDDAGLAGDGVAPNRNRRKEELELFPLDSLNMVGTLDKDGVKWGLVRNKEGMLYRVKTGNFMGQNHGQIIHVSDIEIRLSEIISDGQGGYRESPASVALSE